MKDIIKYIWILAIASPVAAIELVIEIPVAAAVIMLLDLLNVLYMF